MNFAAHVKRAVLALSLAGLIALVLPFQTYLPNASSYLYGAGRLLTEQSVLFAALAALFGLLLFVSDRWLKGALTPLFASLAVLLYVESALLAFGLPELNGELPASLDGLARKLLDGAVWVGVPVLAYAFRRTVTAQGAWIALAALLLGGASLVDARPDEFAKTGAVTAHAGFHRSEDIIGCVEYSPVRNILVFVLDSFDAHMATDLVRRSHTRSARFAGFTAFRNNIGMHQSTRLGVPSIMTGKYFEPGRTSKADHALSVFGSDSALREYQRTDASIFATFATSRYGYTTTKIQGGRRRLRARPRDAVTTPVVFNPTDETPRLSLADATLFRVLPFAFKRPFLSSRMRFTVAFWDDDHFYDSEATIYSVLKRRPVSKDPRTVFVKVHTHGAHPPYRGKVENAKDATRNALRLLADLFDELRVKGVYDRSFIVVCSDHSCEEAMEESDEPPKMRALLWVKPESSSAPFAITEEPTSHAKIASVLKAAATRPLGASEVAAMLRTENRLFRARSPRDRDVYFDYVVDAAGRYRRVK